MSTIPNKYFQHGHFPNSGSSVNVPASKMLALGLISSLLLVQTVAAQDEIVKAHPGRKIVCYFGSWAVYRPEGGKFDVETIDPFLCTHYIFGFTGLKNGVMVALDAYNELCEEWGKGAFARFARIRSVNPKAKIIVAIGGWNEGSARYSEMAKTKESRKRFIDSVVTFLEKYTFDGFDLDWEYPANRGGVAEDRKNFALLIQEFREAFNEPGYSLSAAVSAGEAVIRSAYDIPAMSKYLDFISVMAYDYHGAWEMKSGHHAPLYRNPLDTGDFAGFNVNHSMNFWISQGALREKLVLGMGAYGRGVTLDKESQNGLYAPGGNPLMAGPYTREAGYWGYNEICDKLKQEGNQWTVVVDEYYKAPYAYNGRNWVGYDDVESIKLKSQFVIDNGLGGGMVWSLETDDFQGKCHGERYPLTKTMYRTIIGEYPSYSWEPKPPRSTSQEVCNPNIPVPGTNSTTTSTTPSTPVEPTEVCKTAGLNPDPKDCTKFYNCQESAGTYISYPLQCAAGTAFHPTSKTCAHAADVPECNEIPVSFNRFGI